MSLNFYSPLTHQGAVIPLLLGCLVSLFSSAAQTA
jgi:hypothetical protein